MKATALCANSSWKAYHHYLIINVSIILVSERCEKKYVRVYIIKSGTQAYLFIVWIVDEYNFREKTVKITAIEFWEPWMNSYTSSWQSVSGVYRKYKLEHIDCNKLFLMKRKAEVKNWQELIYSRRKHLYFIIPWDKKDTQTLYCVSWQLHRESYALVQDDSPPCCWIILHLDLCSEEKGHSEYFDSGAVPGCCVLVTGVSQH